MPNLGCFQPVSSNIYFSHFLLPWDSIDTKVRPTTVFLFFCWSATVFFFSCSYLIICIDTSSNSLIFFCYIHYVLELFSWIFKIILFYIILVLKFIFDSLLCIPFICEKFYLYWFQVYSLISSNIVIMMTLKSLANDSKICVTSKRVLDYFSFENCCDCFIFFICWLLLDCILTFQILCFVSESSMNQSHEESLFVLACNWPS